MGMPTLHLVLCKSRAVGIALWREGGGKKKRKCSGRHREEFSFLRGRKTPSLCPLPRVHLSAWAFPSQTTGIANASSGAFPRLGDFVALFRTRNGDVNSAARTLLVFPAW